MDKYKKPAFGIVIIDFNTDSQILSKCLNAIAAEVKASELETKIYLFDNGSREQFRVEADFGVSVKYLRSETNLGFGRAVNSTMKEVTEAKVLLLNPDTAIQPGSLRALLEAPIVSGEDGKTILCGCLISRNKIQVNAYTLWIFSTSRIFANFWFRVRLNLSQNQLIPVKKATGGALWAATDLLRSLGPFDERFFLYGEDADLSIRARLAGSKILLVRQAQISHIGAASQKNFSSIVEKSRADASIRLGAYHLGYLRSLVQRLEFAAVTYLGLVFLKTSSGSRSARRKRFSEIVRWGLRRDAEPLNSEHFESEH
jgi:N-acetylglucosaminyl-diphospho-decaprenol L-rhamnosyltransferase